MWYVRGLSGLETRLDRLGPTAAVLRWLWQVLRRLVRRADAGAGPGREGGGVQGALPRRQAQPGRGPQRESHSPEIDLLSMLFVSNLQTRCVSMYILVPLNEHVWSHIEVFFHLVGILCFNMKQLG